MGLVVVAYDIPNDRRRVRMHTVLSGFGENVQESVFECELDDATLKQLRRRIKQLIRPADEIRIYSLCGACAERIDNGRGDRPQRQPDVYIA